jgi:hypothetical protein
VTLLAVQPGTELVERLVANIVTVVGLSILSGLLAAIVGVVHRWYARARVPAGLAVLVGLTATVLVLNVETALGSLIAGAPSVSSQRDVLSASVVAVNTVTLGASAAAAVVGSRLGDQVGESVFALAGTGAVDVDVSAVVQAVGRVITVELPDGAADIADIEGYDPVTSEVKQSLAGETLIFPRRLTIEELRDRLERRLKSDYGVGHVDVDLDVDGTVTYLAVGSRQSGLGPTLPPETCAVAVRADPANAASAGDLVQVYRRGGDGVERITTAELRGTADDIVTLAVDAADTELLGPDERYRLATLPVEPRSDREFASLLRAADETMGVVQLAAESELVGTPVGAVDAAIVAIRHDGGVDPIPPRARLLEAEDSLYVIAKPGILRRLDAAARPAEADSD